MAGTESIHHPATVFFEASDKKLIQGKRVQAGKYRRQHFLKAPFHAAHVNDWVIDEFFVRTHTPNTLYMSQQECETLQKKQLRTPTHQQQPPMTQPQTVHEWRHFRNYPGQPWLRNRKFLVTGPYNIPDGQAQFF